jgi:hypothetical protein
MADFLNQAQPFQSSAAKDMQKASKQAFKLGNQQPPNLEQIQEGGAALAEKYGKQALTADTQQVQASLAEQRLSAAGTQQNRAEKLQERQFGVQDLEANYSKELFAMDRKAHAELYDQEMKFKEDELGRVQWTEKQLMDYAITKARSDEDLINLEVATQQAMAKKEYVLTLAHKRLLQAIANNNALDEQHRDQALERQLMEAEAKTRKKMQDLKAKQGMISGIITGATTILGAVVVGGSTFGFGTASGAVAGASGGKAAGDLISGVIYS